MTRSIHVTIKLKNPMGDTVTKDMYFKENTYPRSSWNGRKAKGFRTRGKVKSIDLSEGIYKIEFDSGVNLNFNEEQVEEV